MEEMMSILKRCLYTLILLTCSACKLSSAVTVPSTTVLSGAWEQQGNCQQTVTQGANLAFAVQGATRVTAQAYTPAAGVYPSRLAVSVDGGPWRIVEAPLDTHSQQVVLAPALSRDRHELRVVVSGVHELSSLWAGDAGLVWCGVEGNALPPAHPPTKIALFMGDSITAGIVVRGHDQVKGHPDSTPSQSAAELAWPYLTATVLRVNSYPIAFGGSGITVGGNGGSGPANEQFKRFSPDAANLVVLNYGVNDAAHKTPEAAYLNGYVSLIHRIKAKYPKAKIFIMGVATGNTRLNKGLPALARKFGVTYVKPAQGVSTVDGTHPDAAGDIRIAQNLVKVLR